MCFGHATLIASDSGVMKQGETGGKKAQNRYLQRASMGQNFSASVKKSVARLSPSEVAGDQKPATSVFLALQLHC
jgi:hypothetical protein